ncbi:Sulfotransferase [Heracleum sosnowskyi]|uniref:Sulfotransferase n=1 Tax=Heracleum sosnowskyi TaxID=360622 RepID=A0AAD8N4X5_9APIA|nr:Sulfotransferase [Heracleum sosnowskyi]
MESETSLPLECSPAITTHSVDEEMVFSHEFMDLLSTLPKERTFFGTNIYQYKGFWFLALPLHGMIECQQQFKPRRNDIFLVTPPKSGTTWFKAIIYTLLNRQVYHPQDPHHPLLTNTPHQLVPFINLLKPSEYDSISNSPDSSSRIFSAHMPTVILPKSVLEDNDSSNCKIVYLCREIKDTFVSFFHFVNKNVDLSSCSLENAFNLYSRGVSPAGPVWDQIIGYWKESLERPNKVLFMRYEDMKNEPYVQLRRLARFLGKPLSEEEENSGVLDKIVKLCSIDNLRNLEVNKSGTTSIGLKNHTFYRNGQVGDWKKYLTSEMASKLDHITEEKFRGSGLSF